MAEQMIKRRVYDNAGNLLREGMAPKDSVPNKREALMAWWEQQDRKAAEKEAAAAAAALDPVVPAVDPEELVRPVQAGLSALEPRVAELEALRLATPEAVLEGSMQIARAAGAAALVEAAGQTVIAQVDAAAAAAGEQLAAIEGQVSAAGAAVSELVAGGRESLERTEAEMLAKTTSAISKRITGLEVKASQMRGPKGDRGRIGQGLIAGAGSRPEKRPDGSDWAPGDSWLDTKSEGFQLSYMDPEGNWSKPARLVPPPKLINAQQNVLDMAPRSMTTQTIVGTGGGSGSGGEKLLINRAGVGGGSIQLATSDNWAGVSDPKAGELILDLRGLDGAMTGKSGFMVAAFTWDGTDEWAEYALLGDLNNVITVELSIQRGNAVAPSGVTVTIPPGAQGLRIFMRVLAKPGTSGAVNNVSVAGSVEWAHPSLGRAQDKNTAGPQPLWIYV